jgi:hypothetical protein
VQCGEIWETSSPSLCTTDNPLDQEHQIPVLPLGGFDMLLLQPSALKPQSQQCFQKRAQSCSGLSLNFFDLADLSGRRPLLHRTSVVTKHDSSYSCHDFTTRCRTLSWACYAHCDGRTIHVFHGRGLSLWSCGLDNLPKKRSNRRNKPNKMVCNMSMGHAP